MPAIDTILPIHQSFRSFENHAKNYVYVGRTRIADDFIKPKSYNEMLNPVF